MDEATHACSTAEFATPQASRYLQQLCKHFEHKLPVTFDATSGRIAFSSGVCELTAAEGVLRLACTAPEAEKLPQLQDVVARHLIRFAFREDVRIAWRPALRAGA
jgi:hypothetical protein